jgi:hypothetical protein
MLQVNPRGVTHGTREAATRGGEGHLIILDSILGCTRPLAEADPGVRAWCEASVGLAKAAVAAMAIPLCPLDHMLNKRLVW